MNTQIQKTGAQSRNTHHWLDVLEEHQVTHMALDPLHDIRLIEQLQTHPEWIVEFANEEAIFYVRTPAPISF
jgi:hypothetical protein